MRKVSLERYYFVLYDGALTLKMSKMALNSFCDKTLHIKTLYMWLFNQNLRLSQNKGWTLLFGRILRLHNFTFYKMR